MRRPSVLPVLPAPALAAWWRNAATLWEISIAAPQVIAHRMTRMAQAGHAPAASDRREFLLMGQEKAEAFGESMLAMALRLGQAQAAMAASMFTQTLRQAQHLSWPQPWLQAMPGLVASGLKPVHRRVTANARRLGKPRASAGSQRKRSG